MLINVGLRTDIVWFYSEWLFNRFREGFVYSRNPLFPTRVMKYDLAPDRVDAVLFCSKNYAPALPRLAEITDSYRTLFHATVNGYGPDLEPNTPPLPERLTTIRDLSALVGREKIFWRYDPVIVTPRYDASYHIEMFKALAECISPYVSGCIVNFVDVFIRLSTNIPDYIQLSKSEKRQIFAAFSEIAAKHNLPLRSCAMSGDLGLPHGGCVTLSDIAIANKCRFRDVRHIGNQRLCACIESRDIGWYDSCPAECRYCNAVRLENTAENVARHDPTSPLLIGTLRETDTLLSSRQESYLVPSDGQISFFD